MITKIIKSNLKSQNIFCRQYKIFCVNGKYGIQVSSVFFILYIYRMKKIMKEKNQVVPDEVLSKGCLASLKQKPM